MFSLRLVRDVIPEDGSSVRESEYIPSLGVTVPCTRINTTVWTSCNVLLKQFEGWSDWDETEDVKECFYINEWDGVTWVKRQMVDGQTIILKSFDDPEQGELKYHEFITLSNDGGIHVTLKDFADFIDMEVDERIRRVERRTEENTTAINQLDEELSASTEALTAQIRTLELALDAANTRIDELEAQLVESIKLGIVQLLRGTHQEIKITLKDENGGEIPREDIEERIGDLKEIVIGFADDAGFIAG